MAVALSHGNEQRDQRSMHSFFQTAANGLPTTQAATAYPNTSPKAAANFDGPNVDYDASGSIARDISERESSLPNITRFDVSPTVAEAGKEVENASIPSPVAQDTEIDPNYGRRKRQKRTPSTLTVDNEFNEDLASSRSASAASPQSWQAQLQQAAEDPSPEPMEIDAPARTPKSKPIAILSSPSSSRWTPRSTTQQENESTGTKDLPLAGSLGDSGSPKGKPSPIHSLKSTPPKKMLKLSSSGKLLSSPKEPSPVAKRITQPGSLVRMQSGKLTATRLIALKYGDDLTSRSIIGKKIDDILGSAQTSQRIQLTDSKTSTKSTHPFFLGKLRPKKLSDISTITSDVSTTGQDSEADGSSSPRPKKPTDWKDLVFQAKKPSQAKVADTLEAIWPSNELQQLGRDVEFWPLHTLPSHGEQKSKSRAFNISVDQRESILTSFKHCFAQKSTETGIVVPQKQLLSGKRVLKLLDGIDSDHSINTPNSSSAAHGLVRALRASLVSHLSAFDLGKLDNVQDWSAKYSPKEAKHAFQPGCEVLRDWLSQLRVEAMQERAEAAKRDARPAKQGRKKRRRKADELDDFIASSDDEKQDSKRSVKNAILLTGPPGCGKTAAVSAVAHELDFEIFEIHPGMRRSAKDIFDKVGDMTKNHLVQQVVNLDSKAISDVTNTGSQETDNVPKPSVQSAMTKLFGPKGKSGSRAAQPKVEMFGTSGPQAKPSKSQKESLVLFEEVDILFDEDRSFWNGVLTLIEQSKRPVVLTCNDVRDIPFEDLPLHTTLNFEPPAPSVVVSYLLTIAAREGHILERDAVAALYESKGRDLRATLTELSFWCQMTLGSQQGGLDWMLDRRNPGSAVDEMGDKIRVFSLDTFTEGLNVFPSDVPVSGSRQHEELLDFARNDLDIPIMHWFESHYRISNGLKSDEPVSPEERLRSLCHAERLTDSTSTVDLMDGEAAVKIGVALAESYFATRDPPGRQDILHAQLETRCTRALGHNDLNAALESLMVEKPTFPPNLGRLAPSLDSTRPCIATDIAPYARAIVSFDQRLGQQRDELAGMSQGKKTRTTRAARAALEGGNKASTRGERWFSVATDYERILRTGGDWPMWHPDADIPSAQSAAPSPASDSSHGVGDGASSGL